MTETTFVVIREAPNAEKLRQSFLVFQKNGELSGPFACANIKVKTLPEYSDRRTAETEVRIGLNKEPDGTALAVPLRIGAGVDENGKRPLKWLVGAKHDPVAANRKTG